MEWATTCIDAVDCFQRVPISIFDPSQFLRKILAFLDARPSGGLVTEVLDGKFVTSVERTRKPIRLSYRASKMDRWRPGYQIVESRLNSFPFLLDRESQKKIVKIFWEYFFRPKSLGTRWFLNFYVRLGPMTGRFWTQLNKTKQKQINWWFIIPFTSTISADTK